MLAYPSNAGIWVTIALASGFAHAHIGPFVKGMYCINGSNPNVVNLNNNAPVEPLYDLPYDQFWNHRINHCDEFPPDAGDFLDIPAGGSFTVELAANRAATSLDPHAKLTPWGDGLDHPDNYGIGNLGDHQPGKSGCIPSPNLHTTNESMAAGTAFGISYESDISKVTLNNTVVFTAAYHTPYKRLATYHAPSGMPKCPDGGCHCIWGWIPDGCGISNIYLFPLKCQVTPDGSSPKTIGTPNPAVWCEDDPSKCVQGPKQMLTWHQRDTNNIEVKGHDLSGRPKSPAYNQKCGFKDGAQNDIFVDSSSHSKRMKMRRERNSVF